MGAKKSTSEYRILVLHRGWVVVARKFESPTSIKLEDCRVIRRWGKPLADLANEGPGPNTVLESPCVCHVDPGAIILEFVCSEKWVRS